MRDNLNFVADAQALTTEAVSEHCIDLGAADTQPGLASIQKHLFILVTTAAGGMASGARFQLIDDSVSALAGTPRVLLETNLLAAADLAEGALIDLPIPMGKLKQYVGFNWKPVTEASTGLVVDAWVGNTPVRDHTIVS